MMTTTFIMSLQLYNQINVYGKWVRNQAKKSGSRMLSAYNVDRKFWESVRQPFWSIQNKR